MTLPKKVKDPNAGTTSKDMSKWVVPIIVALIGIFSVSGIVNVIIGYLLKPDIFAEVIPIGKNPNVTTINVKNNGHAGAKNLELTIETSSNLTSHHIFATENYSEIYGKNLRMLQISLPRFSEGQGSLITIDTVTQD